MKFAKEYGQLIANRLWIAENDFTIENNGEYYVSNWGSDVTGLISGSTTVNDLSAGNSIRMYPNPVTDRQLFLKINTAQGENLQMKIWDMTGRLIKSTNYQTVPGTTTLTIDVKELKSGYYLMSVIGEKVIFSNGFIVN